MERVRSNMDVYDRLGVAKVINAQARASKIGGSLMHEEVLRAMAEAAGSFVDMSEFLHKAGEHQARLIVKRLVLPCDFHVDHEIALDGLRVKVPIVAYKTIVRLAPEIRLRPGNDGDYTALVTPMWRFVVPCP